MDFMHFFDEMINSLTDRGIFFLHQIKKNNIKNLKQSCLSATELDLNDLASRIWIRYL